nr:hypothetical protein [Tanacetum cinerariifolium]
MESQPETIQTVSALKLPMLKTGDYDIWSMRMEKYLTHTDYALWEVIVNGDAPASIESVSGGVEAAIPPKTTEQKIARRNELKAKNNTSSTNEAFNTAHDVSAASSQGQAFASTYADDVMFSFFSNQSNSLQLDNEDLEQIDTGDLEEMDLKWQVECYTCHKRGHFARECRAPRSQGNKNGDITRMVIPIETPAKALVVTDEMGYDWSYQAEEAPIDFVLMAFLSSGSSSSNTETGLGYDSQLNERDLNNKSDVFESASDSSVNESEEDNIKQMIGVGNFVCSTGRRGTSSNRKRNSRMQEEEGQYVSSYVLKMKSYIDNLERLDHLVALNLAVSLILVSLSKEYDSFVQNYNMHSMRKTVNELHAMIKLREQTLPKKDDAPALHTKMAYAHEPKPTYAPKPKIPSPPKKDNLAKDAIYHQCGEGLRGSRKLKPRALCLYVGDGYRVAVEAIEEYHLCLPGGLVLILHNCHYAPSITRGIISVSRLDGIYEIDLSSSDTNDSSMYAVSNKRAKLNLDSFLLWHCCLGHISKKRIEKLQHDGLLNSTDIKSFEKCVFCMSRKMARQPYSHQVERAKDLLGQIHTDVCGPFRTVSRQGASYFITFIDDFSRYGYVYLLKHKHEVFETFKVFQKEVENQLGKTIKSLCSGRGGEYMSQEFLDHLKEHGIIAHRTSPYTPQHNGLLNDIYSLMDSNKTAKYLWDALARHMLGSEYDEQDRKATVLYEYETFKAIEGELLLDTYIRYLQVINDLKKCGDVNDPMGLKKKTVVVTSDPLDLIAEKTK